MARLRRSGVSEARGTGSEGDGAHERLSAEVKPIRSSRSWSSERSNSSRNSPTGITGGASRSARGGGGDPGCAGRLNEDASTGEGRTSWKVCLVASRGRHGTMYDRTRDRREKVGELLRAPQGRRAVSRPSAECTSRAGREWKGGAHFLESLVFSSSVEGILVVQGQAEGTRLAHERDTG